MCLSDPKGIPFLPAASLSVHLLLRFLLPDLDSPVSSPHDLNPLPLPLCQMVVDGLLTHELTVTFKSFSLVCDDTYSHLEPLQHLDGGQSM